MIAGLSLRLQTTIAMAVTALGCALSIPPLRALIEQSMVWHMVVQMPLLAAAGWLWSQLLSRLYPSARPISWNRYGLTSFMAAQIIFTFWMLPVEIDRAVVIFQADAMKLASLIAFGVLMHRSLKNSPATLQLFFVGYAVSMLLTAGAFLATSERRLCNAYSLDSQWSAGVGLMLLGATMGCTWLWQVFRPRAKASATFV